MISSVGVIVCGGKGERLKKITKGTQKCMVRIAGEPIIWYVVHSLVRNGCRKLYFIVGYKGHQIKNFFGEGNNYGFNAYYIDPHAEGTAKAVSSLSDKINETFLYCHGNIVYAFDLIKRLSKFHEKDSIATLTLAVKDLGRTHAYALKRGDLITDLEIPGLTKITGTGLCCMGVSVFSPEIFEYLKRVRSEGMVEEGVKLAIAEGKKVRGYLYAKDWFHLQTEEDFRNIKTLNIEQIVHNL
jgi:NDP-sugar pyrophosphorylase family protein